MNLSLPLVSIVMSNYNYGRFLGEAIQSVYRQSYEPVECIVVDDASTDESSVILDELQCAKPDLMVIRHKESIGQGAACRTGFQASRGQYVVFMDADDVLHPDFVSTHVYVHLSSRVHPGFSSSDVFQSFDGQLVVCTGQAMNDYLIAHSPKDAHLFRPVASSPLGPWALDQPDPTLFESAAYVPPGQVKWCWSPGTANMYRRDALALFVHSDELASLRICADVFLCVAVGSLCGSVLIDRPLSLYRLHGGNSGSFQAQLKNVRAIRPEGDLWPSVVASLMDYYTRNAIEIVPRLWSGESLITLLESFESALGDPDGSAMLSQCLARYAADLSKALGDKQFSRWTALRRRRAFRRRWFRRKPRH
jgi:glycosyltransferase involved in cell wall biosynthesis